jgi:predicted transcriptional regulator
VREDERLRLEVTTPFALVDPRVASRADNAVLRAIAGDRAISAKEIAERTGLPLRTVQAELGRLVDEGVCRREKDGRNTEYLVEDTVVREPSRILAARDLAAR